MRGFLVLGNDLNMCFAHYHGKVMISDIYDEGKLQTGDTDGGHYLAGKHRNCLLTKRAKMLKSKTQCDRD